VRNGLVNWIVNSAYASRRVLVFFSLGVGWFGPHHRLCGILVSRLHQGCIKVKTTLQPTYLLNSMVVDRLLNFEINLTDKKMMIVLFCLAW